MEALARAQERQLNQLEDELNEVNAEIKLINLRYNQDYGVWKLKEKKRIQSEMDTLSKKLANTRGQLKVIQNAKANLQQSVAIKEGAVELQAVAMAIESLDMQTAVGDIQEAVFELNEHEQMLTTPLFETSGGGGIVAQYTAEQELEALLAEQRMNDLVNGMPPATAVEVKGSTPPLSSMAALRAAVDEGVATAKETN